MPIRTFWTFVAQTDRIQAEADRRLLDLLIGSKTQEGVRKLDETLMRSLGKPIVLSGADDFDESGWADLKRMAQQKIGDKA